MSTTRRNFFSAPDRGAKYCDECVCLSVSDHIFRNTYPICTNFLWMLPVAPGSVHIRWRSDTLCTFGFYRWRHMCSEAKVARRRRSAEAQCTSSLGLGYKLCAVLLAAGQRTHGTIFRSLRRSSVNLSRRQHLGNALFDALHQLSGTYYRKLLSVVTLLQFLSLG